jgi:hypothetical protein
MVVLVALAAVARARSHRGEVTLDDAAHPPAMASGDEGRALLARFECNRCHDGTGLASVARERHCVRCHQEVHQGTFTPPVPAATLARWQQHIVHLREVPSLAALGSRLRSEWVEAYLLAPHALRPELGATMPRLALNTHDARTLARWLTEGPRVRASVTGNGARGRTRYGALGCGTCHQFSGASAPAAAPAPLSLTPDEFARARSLAPDLRSTRDRWIPSAVAAHLMNPRATVPDGVMPSFGLSAGDAADLAIFVLTTPLAPLATRHVPPRPARLARPVRWSEVESRVLRRTCWHCHSEPDFARGEGGVGNVGGFGFAPRGVNLASYEGLYAGVLSPTGERESLLRPGPDGVAPLVRVLLARQAEEAGARVEGVRGMPLGLPALAPDEIALVDTWIAQGARVDGE